MASMPPASRKKGDFPEASALAGPCLPLRYTSDVTGASGGYPNEHDREKICFRLRPQSATGREIGHAQALGERTSALMVGVSIAEGTKLSLRLARRGMRNAFGRLRS